METLKILDTIRLFADQLYSIDEQLLSSDPRKDYVGRLRIDIDNSRRKLEVIHQQEEIVRLDSISEGNHKSKIKHEKQGMSEKINGYNRNKELAKPENDKECEKNET